jgi:hypothetical protein
MKTITGKEKVLLLFLIGQMSCPEFLGQFIFSVEEEVAVHAGREVLMEVDDNSAQIVDDPKGIVDQEIRPHTIYF